MISYNLKIITPPSSEPVTVTEVKEHTRVSGDDQDTTIGKWITSGRELAEHAQRRAYVSQTLEISFDKFPSVPFFLPRPPVTEVKIMKYYDTENAETEIYNSDTPTGSESNYLIDIDSEPARITLSYGCSWPSVVLRDINAFKVKYDAGYTSVPENVKDAIMLYCDWRYENRGAETNIVPDAFYDLLQSERMFF